MTEKFDKFIYRFLYESSNDEYLVLAREPEQNHKKLQEIVNDAAKLKGYTIGPVYHGTTTEKFTIFDPDVYLSDKDQLSGPGINTTDSIEEAKLYGSRIISAFLNIQNPLIMYRNIYEKMSSSEMDEINQSKELDVDLVIRRIINGYIEEHSITHLQIKTEKRSDVAFINKSVAKNHNIEIGRIDKNMARQIVNAFLSETDGITILSAKFDVKRELVSSFRASQLTIIKILKRKGYDGVQYKVHEQDKWHTGFNSIHRTVFDSSQIKSADIVTYDDNGDIIPLSRRFDSSEKDMRY
jgi:hypothetical protein